MASFKKTHIKDVSRVGESFTDDNQYWSNFEFPTTIKEFGAVTNLAFSPVAPHYLASTSSVRVQLYNPVSLTCEFSYTRFKQTAYSGVFRADGQLLAAGGDEGQVRLFRVGTKSLLRVFKKHTGPCHSCQFVPGPSNQLVSHSDDQSSIVWDIPTEAPLHHFRHHKDYVRTGDVSPASPDIIATGSYDHTINVYDVRQGQRVMSMMHGSPIESLIIYPTGSLIFSAGGHSIKVWDILNGGKLLATMANHHKTITCLTLASHDRRLLSASLDRHVQVYDVGSYEVVHTLNYPSPLLSVAVSKDDTLVACGAVDGLLTVKRRQVESVKESRKEKQEKFIYQNMLKGQQYTASKDDLLVRHIAKERLANYDKHLKHFNVGKALDSVLKRQITTSQPSLTVSVIQELIRRGAFQKSVSGRDVRGLTPLMNFITRYIGDPRFSCVLLDVANIVLDMYSSDVTGSPGLISLLKRLQDKVDDEMRLLKALTQAQGLLETICTQATLPATLSSQPATLSAQPATLSAQPATLSAQPATLSAQPATLSAQPATPAPQPAMPDSPNATLTSPSTSSKSAALASPKPKPSTSKSPPMSPKLQTDSPESPPTSPKLQMDTRESPPTSPKLQMDTCESPPTSPKLQTGTPESPPKLQTDTPESPPTSPKRKPSTPKSPPKSPKLKPSTSKSPPTSPKLKHTMPKSPLTSPKRKPSTPKSPPTSPKLKPATPKSPPTSPKLKPTTPKSPPKLQTDTPESPPMSPKLQIDTPESPPTSPKLKPATPQSPPTSPKLKPSTPKSPPTTRKPATRKSDKRTRKVRTPSTRSHK